MHISVDGMKQISWILGFALVTCMLQKVISQPLPDNPSMVAVCGPVENFNSIHLEKKSGRIGVAPGTVNNDTKSPCVLKAEICSSCRLRIEAIPDLPFNFESIRYRFRSQDTAGPGFCRRNFEYIAIFDTYYMDQTEQIYARSSSFESYPYLSNSSSVFIVFCHRKKNISFALSYKIESRTTRFNSWEHGGRGTGFFASPFFPAGYIQSGDSEIYIYQFQAQIFHSVIGLVFDDWYMAHNSEFYFEPSNYKGLVMGIDDRPWVISTKNNLEMRFNAGRSSTPGSSQPFMGFKVTYTFYANEHVRRSAITGCGSYQLFSKGGTEIFEPTDTFGPGQYHDCIWVVKTQPGFDGIFWKLVEFSNQGDYYEAGMTKFEVRSGLTSRGMLLGSYSASKTKDAKIDFTDTAGFYIRLTGILSPSAKFTMNFASYKTYPSACPENEFFVCTINGRCIDNALKCDNFDHCGDNSDEYLCHGSSGSSGSYHYTITVGVVVPMVVSIFLIVVVCLLFVMVRRCRRASELERATQGRPAGSRAARRGRLAREHEPESNLDPDITFPDPPPSYDETVNNPACPPMSYTWKPPNLEFPQEPPSYEEAITPNSQISIISTSDTSGYSQIDASRIYPDTSTSDSSTDPSSRHSSAMHSHSISYSSQSSMDSPRGIIQSGNKEPQILHVSLGRSLYMDTPQQYDPSHLERTDGEICGRGDTRDGRVVNSSSGDSRSSSLAESSVTLETYDREPRRANPDLQIPEIGDRQSNEGRRGRRQHGGNRTSIATQTNGRRDRRSRSAEVPTEMRRAHIRDMHIEEEDTQTEVYTANPQDNRHRERSNSLNRESERDENHTPSSRSSYSSSSVPCHDQQNNRSAENLDKIPDAKENIPSNSQFRKRRKPLVSNENDDKKLPRGDNQQAATSNRDRYTSSHPGNIAREEHRDQNRDGKGDRKRGIANESHHVARKRRPGNYPLQETWKSDPVGPETTFPGASGRSPPGSDSNRNPSGVKARHNRETQRKKAMYDNPGYMADDECTSPGQGRRNLGEMHTPPSEGHRSPEVTSPVRRSGYSSKTFSGVILENESDDVFV